MQTSFTRVPRKLYINCSYTHCTHHIINKTKTSQFYGIARFLFLVVSLLKANSDNASVAGYMRKRTNIQSRTDLKESDAQTEDTVTVRTC
jgi:hypothetical protein